MASLAGGLRAVFADPLEASATRSGDQGLGRPGGQFVQVSSDLWLLPSITRATQILGPARGVRSQLDRDKVRPRPLLFGEHSLRTIQPEILIQIYG